MASQRSTLLSLPIELREIIYEYTFTQPVETRSSDIRSRNAGLLLTSKQVKDETLELYYKRTTFRVADYNDCINFLGGLCTSTRSLVQDVHISPRHFDPHNTAWVPFVQGFRPLQFRRQLLRRQIDQLTSGFRMFKLDLESIDGIELADGVLKVRRYTWNGRVNHHVWTSDPRGVALPSLL